MKPAIDQALFWQEIEYIREGHGRIFPEVQKQYIKMGTQIRALSLLLILIINYLRKLLWRLNLRLKQQKI